LRLENLFVLALQELGKAVLLREAYDTGERLPRIVSFSDHDVKVAKGGGARLVRNVAHCDSIPKRRVSV
jgi:hypothetical protein